MVHVYCSMACITKRGSDFSFSIFSQDFKATTSASVPENDKKTVTNFFGPCQCQFPLRGNTIRSCYCRNFLEADLLKCDRLFSYYESHFFSQLLDVLTRLNFIRFSPGFILQFVNAVGSIASLSVIT